MYTIALFIMLAGLSEVGMEAYSLDLRQRICAACDEGIETHAEVAERFDVSLSFLQKLLRRRKSSRSIQAKPRGGGRKPLLSAADHQRIRRHVHARNDATLAELRQALFDSGTVLVSVSTLCRTLAALNLPRKKRRCTRRNVRRRGYGHYVGTGKSGSPPWTRGTWFLSTKAESTRP